MKKSSFLLQRNDIKFYQILKFCHFENVFFWKKECRKWDFCSTEFNFIWHIVVWRTDVILWWDILIIEPLRVSENSLKKDEKWKRFSRQQVQATPNIFHKRNFSRPIKYNWSAITPSKNLIYKINKKKFHLRTINSLTNSNKFN